MKDIYVKLIGEAGFAVMIIAAALVLLLVSRSPVAKVCAGLVMALEIARIVFIVLKRGKH